MGACSRGLGGTTEGSGRVLTGRSNEVSTGIGVDIWRFGRGKPFDVATAWKAIVLIDEVSIDCCFINES